MFAKALIALWLDWLDEKLRSLQQLKAAVFSLILPSKIGLCVFFFYLLGRLSYFGSLVKFLLA